MIWTEWSERQTTMKKNYYQILEVESDASDEKIREQYLFLTQAWHPDKFTRADQKARAEEMTRQIHAAYDVLRNPARRAEYDRKLQSSKKTGQEQLPRRQAQPPPAPPRPAPVPPITKKTARSKGLFGSLGVFGREAAANDRVRVFVGGRAYFLSVDELVGARVQYFLNGESQGIVDFRSPQHIRAAVTRVVGPKGYEIHVLRLAPYKGRPEQIFTPRVRTVTRR
jgi:curved DNA-binding protein CbpA